MIVAGSWYWSRAVAEEGLASGNGWRRGTVGTRDDRSCFQPGGRRMLAPGVSLGLGVIESSLARRATQMSHTYTNLLYHVIFSTKERRPFIDDELNVASPISFRPPSRSSPRRATAIPRSPMSRSVLEPRREPSTTTSKAKRSSSTSASITR